MCPGNFHAKNGRLSTKNPLRFKQDLKEIEDPKNMEDPRWASEKVPWWDCKTQGCFRSPKTPGSAKMGCL